jgi:hypothetical protein
VAEEEKKDAKKEEGSKGYVFEDPRDNLRVELIAEFVVRCGLPEKLFDKENSSVDENASGSSKGLTRDFIKKMIELIDRDFLPLEEFERTDALYNKLKSELNKNFPGYYTGIIAGTPGKYTIGKFSGDGANKVATYTVAWNYQERQIAEVQKRIKYYEQITNNPKKYYPKDVSAAHDKLDSLDKSKHKLEEKLLKIAKEARKIVHKQILISSEGWDDFNKHKIESFAELEKRKKYMKKDEYEGHKDDIKKFYKDVKEAKGKEEAKTGRRTPHFRISRSEYKERKSKLRERLNLADDDPNKLSKKEYREELGKLRKDIKPSERSRHARFVSSVENQLGPKVTKGIWLAAFTVIGVIISNMTGVWQFTLAFIAWGFIYVLPNPDDFDIPESLKKGLEEAPLTGRDLLPFGDTRKYWSHGHGVWGYFRSLLKMTTYGFFIWGLWTISDLAFINIALVIVSFMAYYSLKIDYDPHKPHELMESLLRFGALGAFVIPVMIFWTIFDSVLLAGIAFAFFAIPPIPNDREKSELFVMYDFYDKILFAVIMLLVLVGFFLGWGGFGLTGGEEELGSTLSTVFVYFWAICGISGFFSPAMARPGIGFLMLGMATFVYASGPGQQEFFSALFGPWWPTIQNTISSIFTPLGEAFSGIGNTFSSGWLLMTNPVGYATQLMNGSHAQNPQGATGPHGIEFNSFTVSQIYPNQPFMANVILRNNGAFEAEDVRLYMSIGGGDAPKKTITFLGEKTQTLLADTMEAESLNFINCVDDENHEYYLKMNCLYNDGFPDMERQYVNQYSFEGNVNCDVVNTYDLRNKAIPLRARVVYDYQVDSNVDVEFISKDEWDRLARDNMLDSQLRIIQSEYSSAPVKLPLGTAGLKNPILATQAFHISILLDSDMGAKSVIRDTDSIELVYPSEWELTDSDVSKACTRGGTGPSNVLDKDGKNTGNKKIVFDFSKDETAGAKSIVCHFKAVGDNIGNVPTKTYKVTAHANYTFEMWKDVSTRVAFGGFCCSDKDCPTGYECDDHDVGERKATYSCVTEGYTGTENGGTPTSDNDPGDKDYCESRFTSGQGKCLLGMGGCDSNSDCCTSISDCPAATSYGFSLIYNGKSLVCEEGIGNGVCCFSGSSEEKCQRAYNEFMRQVSAGEYAEDSNKIYPDSAKIIAAFEGT